MGQRKHVVVVGAGFGGLAVTRGLADTPIDVTIIDKNNYHTFLPLLYQVATSGLNPADVAYPVRGIMARQNNVRFRRGTVTGVDPVAKTLTLNGSGTISYDRLVIAAGSEPNFFGIPGVAEHGYPLYSLHDSVQLRNKILSCYEAAESDPSLVADGVLTFVVVGGGPTGVETAGALMELIHKVLAEDFRGSNFNVTASRVVLVEMQNSLLGPFSKPLQRYTERILLNRGVDVRTSTAVKETTATSVTLDDGTVIPSHTLIWAAGVKAGKMAALLDTEKSRGGRIVVDEHLQVRGLQDVYAIGDIAAALDSDGSVLPGVAPVAIQGGQYVAERLVAEAFNDPLPEGPFTYNYRGSMATVGRRAAVAELASGIQLKGTAAWISWLALHLLYLMGFRNRVSVFINWAWNYFTWDRGARLILGSGEADAELAAAVKHKSDD